MSIAKKALEAALEEAKGLIQDLKQTYEQRLADLKLAESQLAESIAQMDEIQELLAAIYPKHNLASMPEPEPAPIKIESPASALQRAFDGTGYIEEPPPQDDPHGIWEPGRYGPQ